MLKIAVRIFLLAAGFFWSVGVVVASPPAIWTTDAMHKLPKSGITQPGAGAKAIISAARNE